MKTRLFLLFLCSALILSAAGCSSGEPEKAPEPAAADSASGEEVFENEGLRLSVSEDMRDAVIVKTDEAGRIFSVYEKASVEAAERLRAAEAGTDPGNTGEGWLFGIELVNEAQLHEMLCSDMSGADVFARTADGGAYLYLHPTDVRMVRDGDDAYGEQDRAAWAAATEWAAGMPGRLVEENALTAYRRSNTELDMVLARILYRGDVHYELTSLAHGTFTPNAAEAAPCMEALADLTYEYADASQTPDGEYIVMNLPDEDTRFDFFLGGDGSYVRKVRGDYEELYRAEGGADVISPVRALYDSLAAAAGKADYDYEAYNAAMQSVLDEYAALDAAALENYDESAHPELPWYTAAIANTVRNDLYYGVYDFDGNDVPELIIAAGDDTVQVPEAVYAFDGAKMVYLFKEHPMGERAYLTWNGELFATHGSGGAASGIVALYRMAADGRSAELVEVMDYEYSPDTTTVTYTPELGNMTPEEFTALDLGEAPSGIEYVRFASRKGSEGFVGMANPWSEAASAAEAAQGAGLDSFTIPEVFSCFSDEPTAAFLYMDGMAEAILDAGDDHLLLRKGTGSVDISGDYNMYPEERDINWKGLAIHCRGDEGMVRTAWWSFGGNAFSLSFNTDDTTLPGLTDDQVTSLVNQIQ